MSPGHAMSTVSRSLPNICCAYFVAKGRPLGSWVTIIPRWKTPEHTRTKATRSRWFESMPDCTLKTKPEKVVLTGRRVPEVSVRDSAAGAKSTRVSSSWRTPMLRAAAPKSTGVLAADRNSDSSWMWPSSRRSPASSTAVSQETPATSAACSAVRSSSPAIVAPPAVRWNLR